MADLNELLERVKAMDPEDYTLDAEIELAAPGGWNSKYERRLSSVPGKIVTRYDNGRAGTARSGRHTYSMDDAISLVEAALPGWMWDVKHGFGYEAVIWQLGNDSHWEDGGFRFGSEKRPAIALVGALLTALIAKESAK